MALEEFWLLAVEDCLPPEIVILLLDVTPILPEVGVETVMTLAVDPTVLVLPCTLATLIADCPDTRGDKMEVELLPLFAATLFAISLLP